jgi:hypothetical protein
MAAPHADPAVATLIQQVAALQAAQQPQQPRVNPQFVAQLQRCEAAKQVELAQAAQPNAAALQHQGKLDKFTGEDPNVTFQHWMVLYYNQRGAVDRSTLVSSLRGKALQAVTTYEAATGQHLIHNDIMLLLAKRFWDESAPLKAMEQLRSMKISKGQSVVDFNEDFLMVATEAQAVQQPWVVQRYCEAVGQQYTSRVKDHSVLYRTLLEAQNAVAEAWKAMAFAHGYSAAAPAPAVPAYEPPVPMELGTVSAGSGYSHHDGDRNVRWQDEQPRRQQRYEQPRRQQEYRRSQAKPGDICNRCGHKGHWARHCAAEPERRGRSDSRRQGRYSRGSSRGSSRDSRGSNSYEALQNYKPRNHDKDSGKGSGKGSDKGRSATPGRGR